MSPVYEVTSGGRVVVGLGGNFVSDGISNPAGRSICMYVVSGTPIGTRFPLTSVNSIAYFSTLPVGRERDSVQTVAKSSVGGGFGLSGTLKSTVASQNTRSRSAYTAHLFRQYDGHL